ncbi:hypothetical protein B0E53_05951 [Micromonospora sp. MH33]|uniref:hypothetical protein n=1 Tax=Micromonospora sp. MH33 TaxID=1945509 RepID=UPI000D2BA4E5|nr:hypothetical protein [Micromonospora sp. MH33]PSK62150.1 hypothetical protein B0E53_05951 [Micromonospora sp. MH33]
MASIQVRPAGAGDHADVAALHGREWGGPYVVVHDTRYDLRELPTLVAVDGARAVKPSIPYLGEDDIPLHDELRLERRLAAPAARP